MSQVAVIRATLKYPSQEALIEGMRPLISRNGLFIHTKTTRPTGSEVQFEFQLADGSITYSGEGIVRKEVPFTGEETAKSAGMLIALKRINKSFKEVVDAILRSKNDEEADSQDQEGASHNKPQRIVESRAGANDGIDLFGDLDLDAGLDSLFAGIEKKPENEEKHGMSGMYERPTVVSGMFLKPVQDDELQLELSELDFSGDLDGLFDDNPVDETQTEMASADDEPSPEDEVRPLHEFDMRNRASLYEQENSVEFKQRTTARTGLFEPIQEEEVIRRTAAKTGEFQKEANEVLLAERQKLRMNADDVALSSLSGDRFSSIAQPKPMTAVTGRFAVTEELAKAERMRVTSSHEPRITIQTESIKPGSTDVLKALAQAQHELHNDDAVKAAMADMQSLLRNDVTKVPGINTSSDASTPQRPQTTESLFPEMNIDETPSELLEAVQNAFSDSDEENDQAAESVTEAAPEQADSEPVAESSNPEVPSEEDSSHEEESVPEDSNQSDSVGELHLAAEESAAAQSSASLDDLLSQEMAQQDVSGHRREKSGTEQEAAVPKEKVGFFRSLFKK